MSQGSRWDGYSYYLYTTPHTLHACGVQAAFDLSNVEEVNETKTLQKQASQKQHILTKYLDVQHKVPNESRKSAAEINITAVTQPTSSRVYHCTIAFAFSL